MTSALVHTSGLSDSEEEETKYSLKELTKSSACTLNGIFHYERKIKTKEVQKDKIDMINAAMSVHGSDSPEVMFYGTILVSDWFMSVSENQTTSNIDSLISTAAQSAINAINIFRTRNSGDSTMVHATFSLLFSLLGKRLNQEDPAVLAPTVRQALADVVNTDMLLSISPDACGIILACFPLLHELTHDSCFLKKEILQFCLDFVSSQDVSHSDPTTRDIDSLYCYASAYLSACLERSSGESLSWVIGKLFSKSRLVEGVCAALVAHVNTRHLLFTALRFLTQLLATGLWVSEQDATGTASSVGIFGIVTGGGPAAPISGNKSRVPTLFEEIDIESLDDIFSAFSDENLQENDFQIPLVICALGNCLTQFYGNRTTARATAVQTAVKRWSLSAVISADPIVAASGLSLVASMHAFSGESVSFLLHVDTFVGCLGTLSARNPEWAKQEGFAFVRKLVDRPNADPKEIGKYMQRYIEKFKFHPEIMRSDEIKQLFFKSVSVKEAFGRLLDSVIADTVTYEQIVVVSRVLLQMMLAVKAKGSLGDFQSEILRIENDRMQKTSASKKQTNPANMSIIAGLLRAVQLAAGKNDLDTVEILVHVFANLVDNSTDTLDSIVLKLVGNPGLQKKLRSVLDPDGRPIPTPDLDFPESSHSDVFSALDNFLTKCVPRDTKSLLPKPAEEQVEKAEDRKSAPANSGGDWMDSAANWFLDAVGDDEDDEVVTKKKKKKSKKETDGDEDEEPKIAGPIKKMNTVAKLPDPEPEEVKEPAHPPVAPKAKAVVAVKKPAPVAPATAKKVVAPVSMVKKASVAAPARKPPPKAAPPPPEPEEEQAEEEEEEKPKKSKKKKEEDPGLLGGYLGDPAALMGGLGGLWAEEPKKEKKKKKKEKEEEEEVEEEVAPKKPGPKAPPAGKAAPVAKAPVIKKPAPKVLPIKKL